MRTDSHEVVPRLDRAGGAGFGDGVGDAVGLGVGVGVGLGVGVGVADGVGVGLGLESESGDVVNARPISIRTCTGPSIRLPVLAM